MTMKTHSTSIVHKVNLLTLLCLFLQLQPCSLAVPGVTFDIWTLLDVSTPKTPPTCNPLPPYQLPYSPITVSTSNNPHNIFTGPEVELLSSPQWPPQADGPQHLIFRPEEEAKANILDIVGTCGDWIFFTVVLNDDRHRVYASKFTGGSWDTKVLMETVKLPSDIRGNVFGGRWAEVCLDPNTGTTVKLISWSVYILQPEKGKATKIPRPVFMLHPLVYASNVGTKFYLVDTTLKPAVGIIDLSGADPVTTWVNGTRGKNVLLQPLGFLTGTNKFLLWSKGFKDNERVWLELDEVGKTFTDVTGTQGREPGALTALLDIHVSPGEEHKPLSPGAHLIVVTNQTIYIDGQSSISPPTLLPNQIPLMLKNNTPSLAVSAYSLPKDNEWILYFRYETPSYQYQYPASWSLLSVPYTGGTPQQINMGGVMVWSSPYTCGSRLFFIGTTDKKSFQLYVVTGQKPVKHIVDSHVYYNTTYYEKLSADSPYPLFFNVTHPHVPNDLQWLCLTSATTPHTADLFFLNRTGLFVVQNQEETILNATAACAQQWTPHLGYLKTGLRHVMHTP
eukprot:TRINITY_DN68024_c2_g1_i1.p1 TRINITY_DN68024_c2_g1~~TRINITY_DN68024_c2_g1_i1.p1  ORF type:complete len:562 (+),score=51.82 TRINITY_DN68024_c2_g1_i1:221-1906(+)